MATGITTEAALFNHFVKFGIFEGRACCEGFNVAAYKSSYSDLQAAFGDDIVAYYVHYVTFGQTEKRALVTVEAATAAGVTVKSAADGTVVAAGAAKPAAGAASSGSAASTENKAGESNASKGSSGEYKTATNNKINVPVSSTTEKDADEAKLLGGIDYDPASGLFYRFSTYETPTEKGTNAIGGYVKGEDSLYYHTNHVNTYLKSGYANTGDDTNFVNYNVTLNPSQNVNYKVGSESGEWIEWNGKWYKKANGTEEYRTYGTDVSGNLVATGWNFHKEEDGTTLYEVHKNGNDPWNVVFRYKQGTNNFTYDETAYLRKDKDGKLYTTYHGSNGYTPLAAPAKASDDHKFAYRVGAVNTQNALKQSHGNTYLQVTATYEIKFHEQYFSNIKAASGYVLRFDGDHVYGDPFTAHQTAPMSKACDINDQYYMNIPGKGVIILGTGVSKSVCDTHWYTTDKTKYSVSELGHYIYPVVGRLEALRANTVYVGNVTYKYYSGNELDDAGNVLHYTAGMVASGKLEHRAYNLDEDFTDDKTQYETNVPATQATGLIFVAADSRFYNTEMNVGSVFVAPATDKIIAETNGRFYEVSK